MRQFLAACAIGAMLTLVPITYLSISPTTASATSPNGCKTDRYVDDIFCFKIVGPNGTNFVDLFEGTVHDLKGVPLSVMMHVYGPTFFGGSVNYWNQVSEVYVRVGAWAIHPYFMPVFRHLLDGQYCARESTYTHTSAPICWWVFVQP